MRLIEDNDVWRRPVSQEAEVKTGGIKHHEGAVRIVSTKFNSMTLHRSLMLTCVHSFSDTLPYGPYK